MDCPHCKQELPASVVAEVIDGARFQFAITPKDNTRLDLGGIGDILSSLHKALSATAKAAGCRGYLAIVDSIRTDVNGGVTIDIVETTAKRATRKK